VGLDVAEDNPARVASYHRIDLTNMTGVEEIARREPPTYVIHLAAAMPPADESQMWKVNVSGTANLLAGLIAADCQGTRIVNVGSAAEYLPADDGALTESHSCCGITPYGRTKWVQSCMALGVGEQSFLDVMVVRPFNLIGPNLPSTLVVGALCEQFAAGDHLEELHVGNTKSARDFVDVRDAVKAYWLAAVMGQPNKVYNVCSQKLTSIGEILEIFSELTCKSPKISVDPAKLRGDDPKTVFGDHSEISKATGWQPRIKLRDTLSDMLAAQKAVRTIEATD
jgi:GDP-4-dehydro-6-deoxy-D-mannose reductase